MSLYGGITGAFEAAKDVAKGGRSIKETKGAMQAVGEAGKGAREAISPAMKHEATVKMITRGATPAITGAGIGLGTWAGLSGAGAGVRTLGDNSTEGATKMITGVAVLGVLVLLITWGYRYQKVKA